MKKRTSRVSRRIVSLLMSMVLTLTLVTPAAFAEGDMPDNGQQQEQQVPTDAGNGGSGTPIVEGGAGTTGTTPSGDAGNGGSGDVSTPADDRDTEDKGTEDGNKPGEDKKGEENPDGDNEDEENTEEPTDEINTLEGEGENAVDAVTVWDGTVDIDWFTNAEEGTGTAEKPYKISTAEQLAGLAQLVNGTATRKVQDEEGNEVDESIPAQNFAGCKIMLTADIKLNTDDVPAVPEAPTEENPDTNQQWTPIGVYVDGWANDKPFSGTFDGNGHTISGLYVTTGSKGGLFGCVNYSGTVQNLIVAGTVYMPDVCDVGGIVVNNEGKVQNCGFYGNVTARISSNWRDTPPGGVATGWSGTVTNCWYYRMSNSASELGVYGNGNASNCYQNVSNGVNGTYINDDFAAAVAAKLNPTAFEKGWKLWAADTEENTKPPVFSEQNADELALVKLEPYVKNSELKGKVTFADGSTTAFGPKGMALTLQLKDGSEIGAEAVFYTTEKKDNYGEGELKKLSESAAYTANESNTTIYYGTMDEFNAEEGVSKWYYDGTNIIKTEAELRFLATLVNDKGISFQGKRIVLAANITLTKPWTPIGTAENPFKGTFAGLRAGVGSISGLEVRSDFDNAGLFGVVDGGTIQYVPIIDTTREKTVENEDGTTTTVEEAISAGAVTGNGNVGSLVGWLKSGKVENCMSAAAVSGSGESAVVGGLVGKNEGTVTTSYYYNTTQAGTYVTGTGTPGKLCFYLAEKSTFDKKGTKDDTGARTENEFLSGRVLWEFGKGNASFVFDKASTAENFMLPWPSNSTSGNWVMANNVRQLKLTKTDGAANLYVTLINKSGAPTVTEGDTQCVYGESNGEIELDDVFADYMAIYTPSKPTAFDSRADSEFTYVVSRAYTEDTSWYDGHEDEQVYELQDVDDLFGFAKLVGRGVYFTNKTIKLMADIDLEGFKWVPIAGKNNMKFLGTFDGQHHTISNMTVTEAEKNGSSCLAGLFGQVGESGKIDNTTVTGKIVIAGVGPTFSIQVAGIAAICSGEVTNCENKVNITVTGGDAQMVKIGGIVGDGAGKGNIKKTLNSGNIVVKAISARSAYMVGGIVGFMADTDTCWNTGKITASEGLATVRQSFWGGIVGQAGNKKAINCFNKGEVSGYLKAGGVAGGGAVSNSYNLGDVTCTGSNAVVYAISSSKIINSYYICKIGTEEKSGYIQNGAESTAKAITVTPGEDGKNTYKIGTGENAQELVDVLNANCGSGVKWINKKAAPCNPVHIVRWDGSAEDGVEGIVTLTYMPNKGRGDMYSTSLELVNGEASFTVADPSEIGISGRNGSFDGWTKDVNGNGTKYTSPGPIIIREDTTLYAQWNPFWAGAGTSGSPYEIRNREGFMLMNHADAYIDGNTYFKIMNDLDLGSYTPFSFRGNLDGGGNTLTINVRGGAGLFASITGGDDGYDGARGVTIKDLIIEGSVYSERSYVGGLAGGIGPGSVVTLQNVTNKATVTVTNFNDAGGLIGRLFGGNSPLNVIDCKNEGAVTGVKAGGMVGSSQSNTRAMSFTGCTNSGKVTATAGAAAGIVVGDGDASYDLTNCHNTKTGTITANSGSAAGIAVRGRAVNCTNSGTVSSTSGTASGIIGTGSAKRCVNTAAAKIEGSSGAAGIASSANSGSMVEFCANFGEVRATGSVNGLFAVGIARQGKISNCFTYNEATHVPISGVASKQCTVSNSYYLASSDSEFSSTLGGTPATLDDFASGKVAWGVGGKGEGSQGGTGQDAKLGWWKQDKDDKYPTLLDNPDMSKRYYRTDVDCGTGGEVELTRNASSAVKEISSKEAVYGPADTSVTIKATPKDNTFGLKSLTWTHNGQTDVLPAKGTTNIVMPAESNVTIHAEFASVGPGGNGGYYYGGSGDGTGTGDENDEGLQDGMNMDVEYNVKGLVLSAYTEWGSNGGNKSFQKWLEENPNVVRALLTNSLDNMATAAVGKKTDEAKDLAALLLASLNEHTGVDGKDGDTIAKALQKYIDSGSEEVFSAWLTGGGGMASGTYESIYGQYASSLAALADRLYSKWEASGTSMTFPVWLDSQQVSMDSLSENADEPDTDNTNDPQTSDAPEDVPDGQDTEGGASGNSVWEIIGTVVRENPILVWSIVAVIAALIIVGAVRRYHKVKRDEHDEK